MIVSCFKILKMSEAALLSITEALTALILLNNKEVSFSTNHIPFPKPLDVENGCIKEQFNLFKENWKAYGIASGLEKTGSDEMKMNTFFMMIGDAAKLKFSKCFLFEGEDIEKSWTEKLIIIEQRIIKFKRGNVVYERYLFFNKCDQKDNEKFEDYHKRVNSIADNCDFNNINSKVMIRDRLIFGMKNKMLSKKFVKNNEDLTLEKVINESLVDENTEDKFEEMSKANVMLEEEIVNKISDFSKKLCKFCGDWHTFENI